MRAHASPLAPALPAESSVLDVAVPVALAALLGAGVGIVLGRTVFAPRLPPAPAPNLTMTAGMDGPVLPAGAVMDVDGSVKTLVPRDPRDGAEPPALPSSNPVNPLALAQLMSGNPNLTLDGVAGVLGAPIGVLIQQGSDGVLYNGAIALSDAAMTAMVRPLDVPSLGSKTAVASAGRVSSPMARVRPGRSTSRQATRAAGAVWSKADPASAATSKSDKGAHIARFDSQMDLTIDAAMAEMFTRAEIGCDTWRVMSPEDRLRLLTALFYSASPSPSPLRPAAGAPPKVPDPASVKATAAPTKAPSKGGLPLVAWALAELSGSGVDCEQWTAMGEPARLNTTLNFFYGPQPGGAAKSSRPTVPHTPEELRDLINAACGLPAGSGPVPTAAPAITAAPAGPDPAQRPADWRVGLPPNAAQLRDWIDERCGVVTPAEQARLADERGRAWLRQLQAAGITCAAWIDLSPLDRYQRLVSLRDAGRLDPGLADSDEILAAIFRACRGVSLTGNDASENEASRVRAILGGDCAAWDDLDKVQQIAAVRQAFPEMAREPRDLYRLALGRYHVCHPPAGDGQHGASYDEAQWVKQGPYMPAGGPDLFDPIQGTVGDCYLISALAALAWTKPDLLTRLGPLVSTDRRRFTLGGTSVEVSDRTPCWISSGYMPIFCRSNRLDAQWPCVLEKAYAAWRTADRTDRPNVQAIDNSQRGPDLGRHDVTVFAHTAMPIVDFTGGREFWYLTWFRSDDALFDILGQFCAPNGRMLSPMVAGSYGDGGFVDGTGIVPAHAYSVLGIGTSPDGRKFVVLRNPWGHTIPRSGYLVPQSGRWLGRLNLNSGEGGCFALAHGAFSSGFGFIYGATVLA